MSKPLIATMLVIVIGIIALTACQNTANNPLYLENEIIFPTDRYISIFALLEDSAILETHPQPNRDIPTAGGGSTTLIYYRYYFNTSEIIQLGTIDFHASSGRRFWLDGILYFDATIDSPNFNAIFSIDTTTNQLTLLSQDNNPADDKLSALMQNQNYINVEFISPELPIDFGDKYEICHGLSYRNVMLISLRDADNHQRFVLLRPSSSS